MVEMSLPIVQSDLSPADLQLSIIALSVLNSMLSDKDRSDKQFTALKEVLHAVDFFGFSFNPELLVRSLDALGHVDALEALIDKLHACLPPEVEEVQNASD